MKYCAIVSRKTVPLNGKCLKKDNIYTVNITSNLRNYIMQEYKGISATTFKFALLNIFIPAKHNYGIAGAKNTKYLFQ